MLAEQFTVAAAAARNTAAVDEVARLLWRAHSECLLTDADAEADSLALQARRAAFSARRMNAYPKAKTPATRKRREPRSPDRRASIERRRRQAMSGIVPAKIAAAFTMSELAVLSVIGRHCQRGGTCSLPIDPIAALAGCSRTTVKRALRQARLLGMVLVKERRIPGRKSLTNVITVISREWTAWLRIEGQTRPSTDIRAFKLEPLRPSPAEQRSIRGRKRKDCANATRSVSRLVAKPSTRTEDPTMTVKEMRAGL